MKTEKICFGENCFEVEVVKNIFDKAKGLSGRKSLDPGKGMLFAFAITGIYPFTMRNMLMPLDIIWLDKNWRIVDIRENCKPCKGYICQPIIPKRFAKYVLEVNGGLCEKLGVAIESRAELKTTPRGTR